jgi:hypothetical protein
VIDFTGRRPLSAADEQLALANSRLERDGKTTSAYYGVKNFFALFESRKRMKIFTVSSKALGFLIRGRCVLAGACRKFSAALEKPGRYLQKKARAAGKAQGSSEPAAAAAGRCFSAPLWALSTSAGAGGGGACRWAAR